MTILVVEDDSVLRSRLMQAFETRGLEVRGAGDAQTAAALASATPPQLAVVDVRLPGRSGLELVRELKAIDPPMRIVVLTGNASESVADEAIRSGAMRCLLKPVDADQILAAFEP
jgi:two-component system response regulator RegA